MDQDILYNHDTLFLPKQPLYQDSLLVPKGTFSFPLLLTLPQTYTTDNLHFLHPLGGQVYSVEIYFFDSVKFARHKQLLQN